MKKVLSFLALLLLIGTANAQNPFEKFGYTPKIGTLSKGKYVEHFDTDSIVRIGSVLFNPFTKKITGFVTQETVYSEATLKPEIVSRWLTPDPLAEEFPDTSPYVFTNNNPIFFTDPTGLAPQGLLDDYGLDENGNVVLLRETDDNFDRLYAVNKQGNEIDTNNDGTVDDDDSVVVEKGVLDNKKTNTVKARNGKEYTFDQYQLTGDDKAKELFEFASNNSNVEWSVTGVGSNEGENGSNIVTTSHIENSEVGGGYLLAMGYTIRFSDHSHPYSSNASAADRSLNSSLTSKFPNATTRIFYKNNYIRFDSKGSIKPLNLPTLPVVLNP